MFRAQLPPGVDPAGEELAPHWRDATTDPYNNLMARKRYEKQRYHLQVEQLKLQAWVKATGGKGDTIKRMMAHLNPAVHVWSRWKSPVTWSVASGTSSVMCNTCPRLARSCCSTAAGTTDEN